MLFFTLSSSREKGTPGGVLFFTLPSSRGKGTPGGVPFDLLRCSVCIKENLDDCFTCPCGTSYFPEWQLPFIAQFAHPQPQEDLPFFLSRTMLKMISAMIPATSNPIRIVPIFAAKNSSICFSSFPFTQVLLLSYDLPHFFRASIVL